MPADPVCTCGSAPFTLYFKTWRRIIQRLLPVLKTPLKSLLWLILLLMPLACTTMKQPPGHDGSVAFVLRSGDTAITRNAPIFLIEAPDRPHNRIGTPTVNHDEKGTIQIVVNPFLPTVYTEERTFATERGAYTNLIYRIHFSEIPGGFSPYYLGKGKNVGLFVVVTLDSQGTPLLYTTVHTCGCYLAFLPTTALPTEAYPQGWDPKGQEVHGEHLPGMIQLPPDSPPMVLIKDGTHRVKGIRTPQERELEGTPRVYPDMKPLSALETLPGPNGDTASFFETSGSRRGYVKGSQKPRERLYMSWWALDWRIGEDKILGDGKGDGILFYTSLKPWAREASDMRDFATFLEHWGWKL